MVHGFAKPVFYSGHAVEYDILEEFFSHIVPHIFGGIKLRRVRRKPLDYHIFRHVHSSVFVAGRSIHDHQDKIIRELLSHMVQEKRHAIAVHGGQDKVG